ncbi:hypothetical protein (nucleomorph) [Guillardia theta]|uniref:BZIP domain-containing protein n=1 Tax=Guillardia theta TaxID=55529 RepID=Q98RX1_GUITH|nr:hypothetical protein GTHECHR1037 [Guillardia theta]AAK39829.1 hypothetical protein [Guillardia theta]
MIILVNKLWIEKTNCQIKSSCYTMDIIYQNYLSINKFKKFFSIKIIQEIYIFNEIISFLKFIDNFSFNSGLFSFQFNIFNLFYNKTEIEFSEIGTFYETFLSQKRRKRRKFANEEERRIARILKNRKTAEESRQRRIRKMKILESFVIISQEREKRLRKELYFLSKNLMFFISKKN